jgi:hypothetical protein
MPGALRCEEKRRRQGRADVRSGKRARDRPHLRAIPASLRVSVESRGAGSQTEKRSHGHSRRKNSLVECRRAECQPVDSLRANDTEKEKPSGGCKVRQPFHSACYLHSCSSCKCNYRAGMTGVECRVFLLLGRGHCFRTPRRFGVQARPETPQFHQARCRSILRKKSRAGHHYTHTRKVSRPALLTRKIHHVLMCSDVRI